VGSREGCEGRQRADELLLWGKGGGLNSSNEEPRPGGGLAGSRSGGSRAHESRALVGSNSYQHAKRYAGGVLDVSCSAL